MPVFKDEKRGTWYVMAWYRDWTGERKQRLEPVKSRKVLKLPVQSRVLLFQQPLNDHLLHVVVQDFLWVTSEIPKCVLMTPDQCVCAHKKNRKTVIDKQFEYNTYIRDFFADNPGRTLDDAIKCWKYKKQLPGHNHYEQTDLAALD